MLVEQVRELPARDRLLYWIKERHNVFLRRRAGLPRPWTDDHILQTVFFTNPYRENDKVTSWFRENVRDPMRDRQEVLMAVVIFRWFNWPDTAEVLMGGPTCKMTPSNLLINWHPKRALKRLEPIQQTGGKVFTGAYMIKSPPRQKKLQAVVQCITNVWEDRHSLYQDITRGGDIAGVHKGRKVGAPTQGGNITTKHRRVVTSQGGNIVGRVTLPSGNIASHRATADDYPSPTLEYACKRLQRYYCLGGFTAYEMVTDLRHTHVLENASDIMTWSNPGPGAIRGLLRLLDRPFRKGKNNCCIHPPKDYQEQTTKLLRLFDRKLSRMPKFEMREVEHCLCEWDKYERILWGDGKPKRHYDGCG